MNVSTPDNSTLDSNTPSFVSFLPKAITILGVTMLVALSSNIALVIVLCTSTREQLTSTHVLILHNCGADLMYALCAILPQMALLITMPNFYGGDLLCRIIKYVQLVPQYASPYLLVAISIDRYIAVCKPLYSYRWKTVVCHRLALLAWITAFILASPNLWIFQLITINDVGYEKNTIQTCMSVIEGTTAEVVFVCFFTVAAWVIPTAIAATLYILVCKDVVQSNRLHKKLINEELVLRKSFRAASRRYVNQSSVLSGTYPPNSREMKRTNTVEKQCFYKIKTVKLTFTIVTCNFVLLAPFCLINLISVLNPGGDYDNIVLTYIMLVGNANSCFNPWIYLMFNYDQILRSICRRARRGAGGSAKYGRGQRSWRQRPTVVCSRGNVTPSATDNNNINNNNNSSNATTPPLRCLSPEETTPFFQKDNDDCENNGRRQQRLRIAENDVDVLVKSPVDSTAPPLIPCDPIDRSNSQSSPFVVHKLTITGVAMTITAMVASSNTSAGRAATTDNCNNNNNDNNGEVLTSDDSACGCPPGGIV